MLRTNSKKAMENIKKEIMDSYEAASEYYTFEGRESKRITEVKDNGKNRIE